MKYRISVSVDGNSFFWVVVDNGRFIRNPTREDRIGTKLKYYNPTNVCPRCREENNITDKSILYPKEARREKDKDGKETGGWVCRRCYGKDDYRKNVSFIANHRTENLDPNCSTAKGDDFEELTRIWKEVDVISKKNDHYCGPLDHSADSEGKVPQTKGKWYDSYNGTWTRSFENEHNTIANGFDFDYLILYCASKDGNDIERVYEFPTEEVLKISCVTIRKNPSPSREIPWYEQYRKDEEIVRKVNEIWKTIIKKKRKEK